MKLTKKITSILAVLCIILSFSVTAFAAEGKIMFTDPKTAVGQTLEVKGVVEVDPSLGLEDMTVNMTYDTAMLKFSRAEEVTEVEPGKLSFSRIGVENPNRVEFFMYFEVLAAGETTINIADCNIWTTTDEKVYPILGSSAVTIEEGEAVDQPTDQPADQPADAPVAEPGETIINISNTTSITLLSEISHITLPPRYLATTIKVDGVEFPAWQDTEKVNLCILYAKNSNGENALYQYDANEATYQRFEVPEVEEVEEKKDFGTIINSIGEIFEDNMDYVVIGAGASFLLFVIIILVLSIKLYNRNAELDELYEEYGLYEEEEEKETKAASVAKVTKEVKEEKPEKPAQAKIVKVIPVTKKEKAEFIDIKEVTEDDIIITSDDDIDLELDDDNEIEVEFYEAKLEEAMKEVVSAPEVKAVPVEEIPVEEAPVAEAPQKEEEEEYYDDDMDMEFEVDFIDLDD